MNNIEDTNCFDELDENSGMEQKNLISGIAILIFSLYVIFSSINMVFFDESGTDVWYYSPGFFPMFIGAVLCLLSVVLVIKSFRSGAKIGKIREVGFDKEFGKSNTFRLLISVGLLALYVFAGIGHIPFTIATFVYLVVNMVLFRNRDFSVWKILLISAITTAMIYIVFGLIAGIPFP